MNKLGRKIKFIEEDFIMKIQKIYGDKYDYSKIIFIPNSTTVTLTCAIHGDFTQNKYSLLKGYGCNKCGSRPRLNKQEFIERARAVHGDKYDYSKVNYVNTATKIIITCKIHGDFKQTPTNHLLNKNCHLCTNERLALERQFTKEEFIERARAVHGDKYDYSKVNYVNNKTKIIILCSIHGEFSQYPSNHLNKKVGCCKCGHIETSNKKRINAKEFIERSIKIHNNKYDYSKIKYINTQTKVTIICPAHGNFQQTPGQHLSGKGCFTCAVNNRKLSKTEFVTRSSIIHNGKYNYDKVKYINSRTKVIITCPIHGDFLQRPKCHISSSGCGKCKSSKGELAILTILNKYNIKLETEYKIPQIGNKLYYDFYLPEYNLLIEFHGKQHYEYIPFFHNNNEDDFLAQKNRDDIKRFNAKLFKYRYLEFNYKQLNNLSDEQFKELVIKSIYKFRKI